MSDLNAVFKIRCMDAKGLVAAITNFFYEKGLNILNCQQYTDTMTGQYFMRLKMERAKDYLLNTDLSCKEITYRLGFDSASYFNKMFRLYEGITPIQFRNA